MTLYSSTVVAAE